MRFIIAQTGKKRKENFRILSIRLFLREEYAGQSHVRPVRIYVRYPSGFFGSASAELEVEGRYPVIPAVELAWIVQFLSSRLEMYPSCLSWRDARRKKAVYSELAASSDTLLRCPKKDWCVRDSPICRATREKILESVALFRQVCYNYAMNAENKIDRRVS